MRADLHVHSSESDGTDTPAELVRLAGEAGLGWVGLVDHDTVAGWREAMAEAPSGLIVLPGVEISCAAVVDGARYSVHLLAYLPDATHPGLATALARLREDRAVRAAGMVERLAALGVPITVEELQEIAAGAPIGRPHVARALVSHGVVADIAGAFTRDWIGTGGRAYVPKHALAPADAVALVRDAGGVPVLAHPHSDRRPLPDAVVDAMCDAGLVGLEVDHPEQSPGTRDRLRALAQARGLVATGGSDYHGAHKDVRLGAESVDGRVVDQIIERSAHSLGAFG